MLHPDAVFLTPHGPHALSIMVVLRAVSLFSLLAAATATVTVRDADSRGNVCLAISKAISSASSVYYPGGFAFISLLWSPYQKNFLLGSTQYDSDNFHTYGTSSQPSTCSVEPGSAEDVAKIVRASIRVFIFHCLTPPKLVIVGATRTPFAVSPASSPADNSALISRIP